MADDSKYVRRVRGKLASRGRTSKADRVRQYNKQIKNGTGQARPEEFTNASDIDIRHIGENVDMGHQNRGFKDGGWWNWTSWPDP